jgi:diguanylate cyclase (GGDEF)-like protein/PAS domain S-box-containing protein
MDIDGNFKHLVEELPIGLAILNSEFRFDWWNKSFSQLFNVLNCTSWQGKGLQALLTQWQHAGTRIFRCNSSNTIGTEFAVKQSWLEAIDLFSPVETRWFEVLFAEGKVFQLRTSISKRSLFILYLEDITESKRQERELRDKEAELRVLLESTKAIPWKLNWETKQFTYIGPQIEDVLGFPRNSWTGSEVWVERIHPEDQDWVVDYCHAKSVAGLDHFADYRALNSGGEVVWIRDVVRVLQDKNGKVVGLVGFMLDITEKKLAEQELAQAKRVAEQANQELQIFNQKLQRLVTLDGLTGIANRRCFDDRLLFEWTRLLREQHYLALILIDVDYFKQYNDHYGHLAGDDCLIHIAQAINSVVKRSTDLFARYGGEEFGLLLPCTNLEGAIVFADEVQAIVRRLAISHECSKVSNYITLSMGIASMIPGINRVADQLIALADQALYAAKQQGRNQYVISST